MIIVKTCLIVFIILLKLADLFMTYRMVQILGWRIESNKLLHFVFKRFGPLGLLIFHFMVAGAIVWSSINSLFFGIVWLIAYMFIVFNNAVLYLEVKHQGLIGSPRPPNSR
jgi:hypothetical protein